MVEPKNQNRHNQTDMWLLFERKEENAELRPVRFGRVVSLVIKIDRLNWFGRVRQR